MLIVCDRNAFVYLSNVPARRLACARMRILVFLLGFTLSSACSSTSFFESLAVLCVRSQFFREESLFFPTLFDPSFLHFLAPSGFFSGTSTPPYSRNLHEQSSSLHIPKPVLRLFTLV